MNPILVHALRRQMQMLNTRNFGLSAECRASKCKPPADTKCSPAPYQPPCPQLPDCKACKPMSKNPCMPSCPVKKGSYVKYQFLTMVMLCCVAYQATLVFEAHTKETHHKLCCVDYEYMYIRSKRFPWGNGDKSLFHNDHLNCLPAAVRDKY